MNLKKIIFAVLLVLAFVTSSFIFYPMYLCFDKLSVILIATFIGQILLFFLLRLFINKEDSRIATEKSSVTIFKKERLGKFIFGVSIFLFIWNEIFYLTLPYLKEYTVFDIVWRYYLHIVTLPFGIVLFSSKLRISERCLIMMLFPLIKWIILYISESDNLFLFEILLSLSLIDILSVAIPITILSYIYWKTSRNIRPKWWIITSNTFVILIFCVTIIESCLYIYNAN